MKAISCNLPETIDKLEIEIFSDLHLGSSKCSYPLIQERVARVKDNPNVYGIILGDLLNNSTRTSVGDVYEEPLSPMQQIQLAINTFEPVKDKILAVTSGNHERRSYKTDGVDLGWLFARELDIEKVYNYCACLLFVRFGNEVRHCRKMCYTIYLTHGDGQGGRTVGGKANGLQRRGQIVNADIIVTGHTHAPIAFRDAFFEVDYRNSVVQKKEQLFVNASATLDYEEYAELYGMRPSSTKSPVIVLNGHKRQTEVIL